MGRSSEGLDPRRRMLLFRAWHRGIREMDLIMGRFADSFISELAEPDLDEFQRLLNVPDPEVYGWVTGERTAPEEFDGPLLRRLRDFHMSPRET
jgi:antitoxin CptB